MRLRRAAVPAAAALLLSTAGAAVAATTTPSTTATTAAPSHAKAVKPAARKHPARRKAAPPLGSPSIAYLALTFDGKTLTLYVDGRREASRPEPGPADTGAPLVEIGGYGGGEPWNGAIDEVALYRTALSPQAVASRYRIGTTNGTVYAQATRQTPGIVDYWRLDDPRAIRDLVGRANGRAPQTGVVSWYSLIAGSRDQAIALGGLGAELRLKHVPALRTFTVEAWVLPGPQVSNRTIVSRVGGWFIKTDLLGRFNGGFFHDRHIVSVTAVSAAKPPPTARLPAIPKSSGSGGTSPVIPVIVLMAVAGLAAASIPLRRRRQHSDPEQPGSAAGGEEGPEQVSTLTGEQSTGDLGTVVELGHVKHVDDAAGGSGLGVGGAVDDAR